MNLKILVISLKVASERRARISKQLDGLSIPYEFLDATEGLRLTDEWIEQNIGDRLKDIYYYHKPYAANKNALACADSHRKAQLIACSFENGYTLILEDDVELTRDFEKKIIETVKLMQEHLIHVAFPGYGWSVGSFEKRLDINCSGLDFSFFKYPVDGRISGSYSYIIDSIGAKKLVNDNLEKLQDTADWFYIKEKGLDESTVVLYPKLVTTGYFESDIGHLNSKNSLIKRSKKIIYSLSFNSKIVSNLLCYWKERRL